MSEISNLLRGMNRSASQSEIQRLTGIPQPRLSRWLRFGSQAADDALKLQELSKKLARKKSKGATP